MVRGRYPIAARAPGGCVPLCFAVSIGTWVFSWRWNTYRILIAVALEPKLGATQPVPFGTLILARQVANDLLWGPSPRWKAWHMLHYSQGLECNGLWIYDNLWTATKFTYLSYHTAWACPPVLNDTTGHPKGDRISETIRSETAIFFSVYTMDAAGFMVGLIVIHPTS